MRLILLLLCSTTLLISAAQASVFTDNFHINFGELNVRFPGQVKGNEVVLVLNNYTGSGFVSNNRFMFGVVSAKIKLHAGDSAGTVTSFYMASSLPNWYEVDFEFLGNMSGHPYTLQTNVYIEGKGNREQRFKLWFDPTRSHNEYKFFWNHRMIIFLINNTPIRVYLNQKKTIGLGYFDYQPMTIRASIFDASAWATRGGLDPVDYNNQPFAPSYTSFNIANACQITKSSGVAACTKKNFQSSYGQTNLKLSATQIQQLQKVRKRYMTYNYCTDLQRFNGTAPPECAKNIP